MKADLLGNEGPDDWDLPPKPKGMHWRTYNRLVDRYEKYDQQWSLEAMRRFGMWL